MPSAYGGRGARHTHRATWWSCWSARISRRSCSSATATRDDHHGRRRARRDDASVISCTSTRWFQTTASRRCNILPDAIDRRVPDSWPRRTAAGGCGRATASSTCGVSEDGPAREFVKARLCDFTIRCFEQPLDAPRTRHPTLPRTYIASVKRGLSSEGRSSSHSRRVPGGKGGATTSCRPATIATSRCRTLVSELLLGVAT